MMNHSNKSSTDEVDNIIKQNDGLTAETVRNLRALAQNSEITITALPAKYEGNGNTNEKENREPGQNLRSENCIKPVRMSANESGDQIGEKFNDLHDGPLSEETNQLLTLPRNWTTIRGQLSITALPAQPGNDISPLSNMLDPSLLAAPQSSMQPMANRCDKLEVDALTEQTLRQHLEETLIDIGASNVIPKPFNFIPNPGNAEFIYLVGLEAVVNYLTSNQKPPKPTMMPNLMCGQCGTDFTTTWQWFNNPMLGKPMVLCERCTKLNTHTALKLEQANQLKHAFDLVLQHEKEIYGKDLNCAGVSNEMDQNGGNPGEKIPMQQLPLNISSSGPSAVSSTVAQLSALTLPTLNGVTAELSSSDGSDNCQNYLTALATIGGMANINAINPDQSVADIAASKLKALANAPPEAIVSAMQTLQDRMSRALTQGLAANPQQLQRLRPLLYSYQLAMTQAAQATEMARAMQLAQVQAQQAMLAPCKLQEMPNTGNNSASPSGTAGTAGTAAVKNSNSKSAASTSAPTKSKRTKRGSSAAAGKSSAQTKKRTAPAKSSTTMHPPVKHITADSLEQPASSSKDGQKPQ